MAVQQQLIWKKVADIPAEGAQFILPNEMNRSHFIVIIKQKGLYRYDFNNNTWNKYHFIHKMQSNFDRDCHYDFVTVAVDINAKTLYFLDGTRSMTELLIIKNNKNKFNVTKKSIDTGSRSQSIMIKGEYHLIGGFMNDKHLKYNSKLNQFGVMHTFYGFVRGFMGHQIVSFNNNIFVFGGYGNDKYKVLDTIYHYNVGENIWNKLNIKMSKPLYSFGCTTAINNKYILIFGGRDNNHNDCDEIYIFSLLNQSFTESKARCPQRGKFYAITMNNKRNDEMTMIGYVREQWKLSQIADHYFPPNYLLKMMCSYYLTECIHLIDRDDGKHWKISTFDIIS